MSPRIFFFLFLALQTLFCLTYAAWEGQFFFKDDPTCSTVPVMFLSTVLGHPFPELYRISTFGMHSGGLLLHQDSLFRWPFLRPGLPGHQPCHFRWTEQLHRCNARVLLVSGGHLHRPIWRRWNKFLCPRGFVRSCNAERTVLKETVCADASCSRNCTTQTHDLKNGQVCLRSGSSQLQYACI
jgi:hypothetical protein